MKLLNWQTPYNGYACELQVANPDGYFLWLNQLDPIGVICSWGATQEYPELCDLLNERFHHQYPKDQMETLKTDIWDYITRYLALENFV